MPTTQINQIPYPSDSDDPDITDVQTMIAAVDDLLCPTIPRSSLGTRYTSPETGALVYATGDNRLDIYDSSVTKWLTASYKYAPLRNQLTSTSGTTWVDFPGAYFTVYAGERYIFHGAFFPNPYLGSDNLDVGWSLPSLTASSWNVRCTSTLATKTASAMTVSKAIPSSQDRFRVQGYFVPSANGVVQFQIKKDGITSVNEFTFTPNESFLACARIA